MVISTEYWTMVIEESGTVLLKVHDQEGMMTVDYGERASVDEAREAVVRSVDALLITLRG